MKIKIIMGANINKLVKIIFVLSLNLFVFYYFSSSL